jgi:hypothetical protein
MFRMSEIVPVARAIKMSCSVINRPNKVSRFDRESIFQREKDDTLPE